jgi:hypothetical protein
MMLVMLWRIVKLGAILGFLPQGSSSIFEFATNIILSEPVCFMRKKRRTRPPGSKCFEQEQCFLSDNKNSSFF